MTELSGWVLILWLFAGHGGGPTTAVFYTQAACEEAGKRALAAFDDTPGTYTWTVGYVCVRDGSD